MIRNSRNTKLDIYHGVPLGWTKSDIVSMYQSLSGENQLEVTEATEPGAPSWLPDRYNWLQYRATLYEVAELIRLRDKAAIEIAIRYIELDYFGSYSGYLKERFARILKIEDMSDSQKNRLTKHFTKLIENRQCMQEFRVYAKLLNSLRKQSNA